MDNLAIARALSEIGDLLELNNENAFKIRAYRNAAEIVAHTAERLADLTPAQRLALPGIGKDLAAKIGELAQTGVASYHQELLRAFPAGVLDLLHLQGVGPKTAALLYRELHIATLEELAAAISNGRVRNIKGMGAKKEALLSKALAARPRAAGRRLLVDATNAATALVETLRSDAPDAHIAIAGSVRRGRDTCGNLRIVATAAPSSLADAFVTYRLAETVVARGQTRSSIILAGGLQADLHLVPIERGGAALLHSTGAHAHISALRERARGRGLNLDEHGLKRIGDGALVAGKNEDEIYEALGLTPIPPELREDRGEIEAAARDALPNLISLADLRGDLHMHTTASDGRSDIETMARAARAAGLDYIAITEHSQSLAVANGLDEQQVLAHAARVREIDARLDGITVLAGIECDILADGAMDLHDDCLAALDLVIASVHSSFAQEPARMTDRLLRALSCPWVDILAHPTGRRLLKRDGYEYDIARVFDSAARQGVAVEINSNPERLDLNDGKARLARDSGVRIVVDSDAHSAAALGVLRWGISVARRAWLTPDDVLNTRTVDEFRRLLRRNRRPASP